MWRELNIKIGARNWELTHMEYYLIEIRSKNDQALVGPCVASDVAKIAKAFCDGEKSIFYGGGRINLEDRDFFRIHDYSRIQTFASEVGITTQPTSRELSQFIARELIRSCEPGNELDIVDFFLRIGDEVTWQFIKGGYGEKKYGEKIQELILQPSQIIDLQNSDSQNADVSKSIFVSHSSKDKSVSDLFVDEFLERGLGVDTEEIYYTSSAVTGISPGLNWKDDIREGVIGAKVVVCLISENYHKSQYCIAELGAAWAFDKVIIPILIPPIVELTGGQLYAHLQVTHGDNRQALSRLKDELIKTHGIGSHGSSSAKWEKALSKFVEAVEMIKSEAGKK